MTGPSDSELAGRDDASLVVALVDRIRPRYEEHGLASLNTPERVVLAVYEFDNEACNGGFGQWVMHVAGDLASTAPACLETNGDMEVAALTRHVLAKFGEDGPSADYWTRMDQIEALAGFADETIQQCDAAFVALEEPMHKRLCIYARSHLTEIRAAS
jgi:hypothetical protein